ncbi:MAG: SusE domain-containing protein [Omnitrophica WOR_2 bacterium]
MKRKFVLYIALLGLFGVLASCKKDGETITMLKDPIPPTLVSLPNLTLERNSATDTLIFVGTPVNPGFNASANYFLEAAAAGTNFADPVTVANQVSANEFKITVSDLNGILLKKFPADTPTSVDFRIRSVLVVASGTGAPGSGDKPMQYISEIKTADVLTYGLPRLDLNNSGKDQKVESALGDGNYIGYVKLDAAQPFTLTDPDTNKEYGGSGGTLAENGAAIVPPASGWYILKVSTTDLTYSLDPYMIGLVGSATPNGWDAPDQKMDYNAATGTWDITIDLVVGDIKFRKNDGWAWNLGGTPNNLVHNGDNIPVTEAGNYTISLTITSDSGELGTFTMVKNN